jgi:hypothetical protein
MTRATSIIAADRLVSMELPVRQAVIVPSTADKSRRIPKKEHAKRVDEVKKYLADTFGGYTAISAKGGYYLADGKKVEEPTVMVVSFTTRKSYKENKPKLYRQINKWGRNWGQETMGYEYEDDMKLIKGL